MQTECDTNLFFIAEVQPIFFKETNERTCLKKQMKGHGKERHQSHQYCIIIKVKDLKNDRNVKVCC